MSEFRAVIFDLGGVVIDSPLHTIAAYERDLGIPDGFVNRLVVETGPTGAWSRLERGEIDRATFERDFDAECQAGGHPLSAREMMRRISECAPRPSMLRAIDRLRAADFLVAALTNNWVDESAPANTPHEFSARFHVVIESAKTGLRKPDPRIYELACQELGVQPHEAVFLDDIGRNLKTARALGMRTIKVDAPEPALAALTELVGIDLS
ncbi:MAG: HAD family phosphatase [Deltaproteobacteria bacterium]|nr:HAD family phosphatase [Deltaproteobacteria bacterium]MBW2395894.1 HAD family phosphatase [Deltaproteobacteria bacterium]